MKCLVAMGPAARPALRHLDRLVARRRRVAGHVGVLDDQMRADENLMAAAITTRRQIAGLSTAATTPRQPQGRNDRQASVCPVS